MKRFAVVLGLCIALAMVVVACGGGSKKPAASPADAGHAGKPVETAAPAAPTTSPDAPGLASCPVKPATNCAFALTVRDWVAAAGIDSLVKGSAWDTPEKTQGARKLIDAAVRGGGLGSVEAVSVGCPVGAGGPLDCAANFSVALSAVPVGYQLTTTRNILVLGFAVTNAKPVLTTLTTVSDPSLKQTIFAGGLAQGCDLSGKLPNAANDCTRATFSPLVIAGSGLAGAAVLGIPVRTWKVNAPAQLPQGVALFVEKGCWGCEGYSTGLERVYRDAAGTVHTDTVFSGAFLSVSFSADAFEAYATVCIDVCGPLGPPATGSRTTIYHSVDGGITWTAEGTVDGIANVLLDGSHWVLYQYIFNGGDSVTYRFSEYPGGTAIVPPAGTGPGLAIPGSQMLFADPTYAHYLNPDGSPFLGGLPGQLGDELDVNYGLTPVARLGSGDVAVRWQHPIDRSVGPSSVPRIGIVQNSTLMDVIEPARVGPNVDIGVLLGDGRIFGNADLARIDVPRAKAVTPNDVVAPHLPVLIDLVAGEVTPLLLYGDYLFDGAYAGRNIVVAAQLGPFARVNTGGDCLNVRRSTSTSSPTVGCFKDGILLRWLGGNDLTAEGISWVQVMTPDGNRGWASAEFLQR